MMQYLGSPAVPGSQPDDGRAAPAAEPLASAERAENMVFKHYALLTGKRRGDYSKASEPPNGPYIDFLDDVDQLYELSACNVARDGVALT